MQAELNLLYVLVAIRTVGADRHGLLATGVEGLGRTPAQLKQLLIERDCLSPEQASRVEADVDVLVQRYGGDPSAALEASVKLSDETLEPTVQTDLGVVRDLASHAAVRDSKRVKPTSADESTMPVTLSADQRSRPHVDLEGTTAGNWTGDSAEAGTADFEERTLSRYTLTRVHGKGGLGQVWLAVDRQLNRRVALKELRPDRGADEQSLRRFVKEAQITGQLEHPNIVPVYELSSSGKDGLFYTMRFLRGRTLREAIREYHSKRKGGGTGSLELRHLLQAFAGICNAIAYAASKGVVHRDLKPGNIMMGSFGEVVVLDWGLAKTVDEQEEDTGSPSISVTGDAAISKTLEGQVLGTPGYLSPEQADGDLKKIDARTDVYGLGAILFAILTGRAPHRLDVKGTSRGTHELLKRIADGPSPSARSVAPATPAALDAICAKAMAKRRGDRYRSAAELAEDVLRWISDEPVSAHQDPLSVRFARWTRRHRTWAQAVAASLLVVAGVSTAAAFLVNDARRNEQTARRNAEQAWADERQALAAAQQAREAEEAAKADATRRFHDAQETVHRSLTGVAKVLLYFPGVQPLRAELLEQAAMDLERFAAEDSEDLQLQLEAGRAIVRLGDVRGLLYQWDDAREQYERAENHFVQLRQRADDHLDLQKELAECRQQLAFSLDTLGRRQEAGVVYARVVAAFDELVTRSQGEIRFRVAHAAALVDLAQHLSHAGNVPQAIGTLETAEAAFQQLVDEQNRSVHRQGLAAAQRQHGQLLKRTGKTSAAVVKLQEAMAGFKTLQLAEPNQPNHLEELADCHIALANALLSTGREQESVALYSAAIADYKLLLEARPGVPQYRESLALIRRNRAQQLVRSGRSREAYEDAFESLLTFDELLAAGPSIPRYVAGEAACSLTFGQVLRDLDENELARVAIAKAIQNFGDLAQGMPEDIQYLVHQAISYTGLGRLLEKVGEPRAARNAYRNSIRLLEARVAQSDDDPHARDALAWSYARLADNLQQHGEAPTAGGYYEKCLAERDRLTDQPPHLFNLAWFLIHSRDENRRDPERAAEIVRRLIELVPQNANYHHLLGVAEFHAKKWDHTAASMEKAASLRGKQTASDTLYLAMARWHQGNKEDALAHFREAEQVMQEQQPGNIELIELRDVARQLLELGETGEPEGCSNEVERTNAVGLEGRIRIALYRSQSGVVGESCIGLARRGKDPNFPVSQRIACLLLSGARKAERRPPQISRPS